MKHNCEKLRNEARGCSICGNLYKNISVKDLKELQKYTNWYIIELTKENERLKQQINKK